MLQKSKIRKQEGFTIIEVLIVLAIAGLIIAIVLFAVPALQRNGRNTAIKNDANSIAGYIGDYESVNDGALPTGGTITGGVATFTGATSTNGKVQGSTTGTVSAPAGAPGAVTPTAGTVTVVLKAACPDTVSGTSVTPVANARAAAVIYGVEINSSTIAAKCVSA